MAAGWCSCSLPRLTWLWHLLDSHSPSQKAGGGQQGRASSGQGRASPQKPPGRAPGLWGCVTGGFSPTALSQAIFNPAGLR